MSQLLSRCRGERSLDVGGGFGALGFRVSLGFRGFRVSLGFRAFFSEGLGFRVLGLF